MRKLTAVLTLVLLTCGGCMSAGKQPSAVYPMSYDQTYEAVLTALDDVPNWHISSTDQLKGLITVEAGGFLAPRRQVQMIVKRVEPFRTSVEIHRHHWLASDQKFFDALERHVQEKAVTYPS